MQKPRRHEDYKVAVLFAMEFEMSAFRYMLDATHPSLGRAPGDSNRYILGSVASHNVVLTTLSGQQGTNAAATVSSDLSRTFPAIEWRLLVGIGGGVTSATTDMRLGDVVISMPNETNGGVIQYDLGREWDGRFQRTGFLDAPPRYLRSAVDEMRSTHRGTGNNIMAFVEKLVQSGDDMDEYKRPDEPDLLFPDEVRHQPTTAVNQEPCSECDKSLAIHRGPRNPEGKVKIHYGVIASRNSLIVSTEKRKEIIDRIGHQVMCFEMEAVGVMSDKPCLVVRGISDYADSHKNRGWRHYAAATAAACAKDLLSHVESTMAKTEIEAAF
ncbi:purine and uridine phosphorylase [Sarocladium strictum]